MAAPRLQAAVTRALTNSRTTQKRLGKDVLSAADVGRIVDAASSLRMPSVLPVRANAIASGNDWIGLRTTDETELLGVTRYSLFSGFLGLALLLLILSGTWLREGR